MEKGNISVQTENIFPIIKKFLYSDQEIFLRELVSNAVDATTKLRALSVRGEQVGQLEDLTIDIQVDQEQGTLTISDQGIGMTEEEVKKYLNQLAFSSAQEFLEKYKDETGIIGNFGLGFYSAFMVADKVEVVTRSYLADATPVRWTCEGDPSYEIGDAERDRRGTDIILHISDDSKEYLEEDRIEGLLLKYAKFLPVPIRFGTRTEKVYADEEDKEGKDVVVDNIINTVDPVWRKSPQDLTDEDYRNFYRELYPMSQPPMFWIHLNIDFPFNLTGILYFPKLANGLDMQKNKIQLYSNQVYVTDDVKEIVPEFLTLLHGVIDSPDIPLNVSRSYLQADQNVKKITGYITRKVADKLGELFKDNREDYEQKWSDLGPFVKYGMITDEKFYEKAKKFVLFSTVAGKKYTLAEVRELVKDKQIDKYERTILIYTHAPDSHHPAIQAAQNRGYEVLVLDNVLDNHFLQALESKEDKLTFTRIDSATIDQLVQTDDTKESVLNEEQQTKVKELFTGLVSESAQVELKPLAPDDQPVQIVRPEFMRRMKEMQAMQGMSPDMFPDMFTVVVNSNHPLVSEKLLGDEAEAAASYLYDLALLSQNMLTGEKLTQFMARSLTMLK